MRHLVSALVPIVLLGVLTMGAAPHARADEVAYLLNVTVRPGYNFQSSEHALAYGRGVCERITRGDAYSVVLRDVMSDFNSDDEFQGTYLISQAANELCSAAIWQLRRSAAANPRPTFE